jgi:hypothetical protein
MVNTKIILRLESGETAGSSACLLFYVFSELTYLTWTLVRLGADPNPKSFSSCTPRLMLSLDLGSSEASLLSWPAKTIRIALTQWRDIWKCKHKIQYTNNKRSVQCRRPFREGCGHGLINYKDTKAKCRHLKNRIVKGLCGRCLTEFIDWRYRQSLVFSTKLCELLPL